MTKRLIKPLGLLLLVAFALGAAACDPSTEPYDSLGNTVDDGTYTGRVDPSKNSCPQPEDCELQSWAEVTSYTFNTDTKEPGQQVGDTWVSPKTIGAANVGTETGLSTGTLSPQPYGSNESGGTRSAAGCRSLVVHVIQRSLLFHTVIYSIHYQTGWCWYLTQVYNVTYKYYYHSIDNSWEAQGLVSSSNGWYTWKGFAKAGYRTTRMWQFQQCFWIVCNTNHPEARVNMHGDGTYSYATEDH